jgi:hypothetical protein
MAAVTLTKTSCFVPEKCASPDCTVQSGMSPFYIIGPYQYCPKCVTTRPLADCNTCKQKCAMFSKHPGGFFEQGVCRSCFDAKEMQKEEEYAVLKQKPQLLIERFIMSHPRYNNMRLITDLEEWLELKQHLESITAPFVPITNKKSAPLIRMNQVC